MFKFLGEKLQRVSSITLNSQPDISSVSATFLPISYAYAYSYPYAYSYTYCMFGSSQFRGYGLPLNWNGLTLLFLLATPLWTLYLHAPPQPLAIQVNLACGKPLAHLAPEAEDHII